MYLSPRKKLFVDTASDMFGAGAVLKKAEVIEAANKCEVPEPYWFKQACRVGHNAYKLPNEEDYGVPAPMTVSDDSASPTVVNLVATNMEKQNLVPAPFEGFVAWGNFSKIEKIIKSGLLKITSWDSSFINGSLSYILPAVSIKTISVPLALA